MTVSPSACSTTELLSASQYENRKANSFVFSYTLKTYGFEVEITRYSKYESTDQNSLSFPSFIAYTVDVLNNLEHGTFW